jgi:protein O-mannosyl-transferase
VPQGETSPQSGFLPGWIQRRGWVVPTVLALVVYINVLHSGLAWDDNMGFQEPPPPTPAFRPAPPPPGEGYQGPAVSPQAYYRPLINYSFQFDRMIWGSNPVGFHFSVYLAHAAVTLLFYECLLLLLDFYREDRGIAVVSASLFAVHPIHVETVAWIAGRNDVFTALFVLIALYAYLRYRRDRDIKMVPLFAAGMVLGLLGKETAIPFMMIFPALEFLFRRSGVIPRRGIMDPLLGAWSAVMAGFLIYRLANVPLPSGHGVGSGSSGNELMTFFVSLGYYIKLLFVPHPLNLFVGRVPSGNFQATGFFLIGFSGSVALSWMLIRGTRTLWGVAAAWFILGLAAPMLVPFVKVSATPLAERYAYIASGGFLLAVGLAVFRIRHWIQAHGGRLSAIPWVGAIFGTTVIVFFVMTFARNIVWRDEVGLWRDTIEKSPGASFPHFNLGLVYELKKKDYDNAIRYFQEGLEIDPKSTAAHNRLANLFVEKNQLDEAGKEYERVSELQPASASAHYNLAVIDAMRKKDREAIEEFQSAIRLNPNHANAHYNLGLAYANRGQLQEAIGEFKTVIQIQPKDSSAYTILGDIYRELRQLPEAIEFYRKGLQIDPNYPTGHLNLGMAYELSGKREEAESEYREAIRLEPGYPQALAALSALLEKKK